MLIKYYKDGGLQHSSVVQKITCSMAAGVCYCAKHGNVQLSTQYM